YDGSSPVLKTEVPGFQFDTARGVDYAIDLSRPEGARVVDLRWHGKPLDPNAKLRVVANSYRLAGGGDYVTLRRAKRVGEAAEAMPALLVRWARAHPTLRAPADDSWSVLPDYAGAPERALVDRLVRLGVAPRSEVQALAAMEPARREDVMYWLARAFGIRAGK